MTPELKQKWIEALRSGKYKQTRRKLKARNGSMCCLGVLCDVMGRKWKWDEGLGKYIGDDEVIRLKELRDAGIETGIGLSLAEMNDGEFAPQEGKKYSFAEIADWIENNL